jgi:DNA processing protein
MISLREHGGFVRPSAVLGAGSKPAPAYAPPQATRVLDTRELFDAAFAARVPCLYAAGDGALLRAPSVAIVGSRRASPEGLRRAYQLARDLVRRGVVVLSGLAAGIDTAAHEAALAHGGRTIAVIGTSLERAYPAENAALQEHIYRGHLLLSPFAPGTRTQPGHFPARNRVMARLARATVVVEACDASGSLHQVAESVHAGRPVFVARSVAGDARLTWPARWLCQPSVHVLETSAQVVEAALSTGRAQVVLSQRLERQKACRPPSPCPSASRSSCATGARASTAAPPTSPAPS